MTDTTALQALADKVEMGTVPDNGFCAIWHRSGNCVDAQNAYHGSLDAAKALDEAVLPKDYIVASDSTGFAHIWRDEFEVTHSWTALISGNEARARLLAILLALIAGGRE